MKLTPRVLLLDDDVPLRRGLRDSLEREGLDVRIARSVPHLINLARQDHFDACILDIRLSEGGHEGLEAIGALRKSHPHMYVEVLTAYEVFRKRAFSLGADAVFIKPKGVEQAAQRIKRGILRKKLSLLEKAAGIQLEELLDPLGKDDDYQVASTAFSAEVLAKCATRITSYLKTKGKDYGLSEKEINVLTANLGEEIAGLIADRKQRLKKITPELEIDTNYQAYLAQREKLEKEHMNQYVAFVDGKLVDVDREVGALLKRLDEAHGERTAFVKKITAKERVVAFRRPKRVKRT